MTTELSQPKSGAVQLLKQVYTDQPAASLYSVAGVNCAIFLSTLQPSLVKYQ